MSIKTSWFPLIGPSIQANQPFHIWLMENEGPGHHKGVVMMNTKNSYNLAPSDGCSSEDWRELA